MDFEKINDFVNCWAKALNVPANYASIVKETIVHLTKKYSPSFPNGITTKEDPYNKYILKANNGVYSLEDFFLNRLLRNVWSFETNSKYKGDYQPAVMEIHFNEDKIKNQLNDVIDVNRSDFNQLKKDAAKKVIMYEFEHALQTRYTNECLDLRYRQAYKNIIDEIRNYKGGKYKNIINTYEQLKDKNAEADYEQYLSCGFHFSKNNKGIKTYREAPGFEEINEIFTETESLDSAEITKQGYVQYGDGAYRIVRNAESSNSSITEYGYLLKTLLGRKISFIGMYLNPSFAIQAFNQHYGKVFSDNIDNDKDAWENLLNRLSKIKKHDRESDHLFLQAILAKCMFNKIERALGRIDEEKLNDALSEFEEHCIWGKTKQIRESLPHVYILEEAKEKIEAQKNKQR